MPKRLDLPRFTDPDEVVGIQTAFNCERKGWFNSATAGYTNTFKAYAELISVQPTVRADALVCLYGLLRCAAVLPSGEEHIAGYEGVINTLVPELLEDTASRGALEVTAHQLSAPFVQDAFGQRGAKELQQINMQMLVHPETRFKI